MKKNLKKASTISKPATAAFEQITERVAAMASKMSEQPSAKQIMESAQQIWLAGLGAFAKAQNEGRKMFDTLVKQGEKLEKQTRNVAEATIETAKEQAAKTMGLASGKFDKLEAVFEERVHKSLTRLGVLTRQDVENLSEQVSQLADAVRALLAEEKRPSRPSSTSAKVAKPTLRRPVAKKPAQKTTAKKPAARKSVSRSK